MGQMSRGHVPLKALAGWMCWLAVAPVYAEVMDKEPTLTANWALAVAGGLTAIFAWRWRWWLGAAVSTIALDGVWLMHLEIADPSVGRAIRLEAGTHYVMHFYWSAAAAIALHVFAAYTGLRRSWGRARGIKM